jgi:1-aminocyclopropane-1-carboxylate deaminase/D-cysteine desulfhydrase-like pyridoxal-dependent ACC family enzyme
LHSNWKEAKLSILVDLLVSLAPTPLQEIEDSTIREAGGRLYIKRDDLIHPDISGNKWRKLKYQLLDALEKQCTSILTFGGAYSNHLYATAAACAALNIKSIGIVRGEDQGEKQSPTLQFCKEHGMQLHFVSRQQYRARNEPGYITQLLKEFNNPYIIPEGGTTSLALPGVREMVSEVEGQLGRRADYYCVAAGTGGTAAGILSAGAPVIAFSALKGGAFLKEDILKLVVESNVPGELELIADYHFGGYAKWNTELLDFIDEFKSSFDIQLEQVYTGKMLFGLFDLIKKGYFRQGSVIVAVHTGGLQGLLRK